MALDLGIEAIKRATNSPDIPQCQGTEKRFAVPVCGALEIELIRLEVLGEVALPQRPGHDEDLFLDDDSVASETSMNVRFTHTLKGSNCEEGG